MPWPPCWWPWACIAVVLSTTLPVFSTMARREREAELIFRGQQYARAVTLFQRKYGNALPPSIDVLLNGPDRFLRKQYKDPITGGDFQLVGPGSPELAEAVNSAPGQQQPGRGGPQVVQQPTTATTATTTTAAVRARYDLNKPAHSRHGSRRNPGRRQQEQGHLAAGLQQSQQVQRVGLHRDANVAGPRRPRRNANAWWSWWSTPRCRARRRARAPGSPAARQSRSRRTAARRAWRQPTGRARYGHSGWPASRSILATHRSSITASCTAGLTRAMAWLSGLGCTRFVRSATYTDRSGSIHNDVPVKPT